MDYCFTQSTKKNHTIQMCLLLCTFIFFFSCDKTTEQSNNLDLALHNVKLSPLEEKSTELLAKISIKNNGTVSTGELLFVITSTHKNEKTTVEQVIPDIRGNDIFLLKIPVHVLKAQHTKIEITIQNLDDEIVAESISVHLGEFLKDRADLIVETIIVSEKVKIDETVTFISVIKNTGKVLSDSTLASVSISGMPVQTYRIPTLAPGEKFKIYRPRMFRTSGRVSIETVVDPQNNIAEENEKNNTYLKEILVHDGTRGDLHIELFNTYPQSPTIDDTITIEVVVKNSSELPCSQTVGELQIGQFPAYRFEVPPLASGETFHFSSKKKFPLVGEYSIQCTIDYFNDINESDEHNNVESHTIFVTYGARPDLSIVQVNTDKKLYDLNDTVAVFAVIQNKGNLKSGATTALIAIEGFPPQEIFIPALEIGEQYTISRLKQIKRVGKVLTEVVLDNNNLINEIDEQNNRDYLNVLLGYGDKPLLVVKSFTITPPKPAVDDTVVFNIVIKNEGKGVNEQCEGIITLSGNAPIPFTVPPVAFGDSTVIVKMKQLNKTGTYSAQVSVSCPSKELMAPAIDLNNLTKNFVLSSKPLGDLVIENFYCLPDGASVDDIVSIIMTIKNIGHERTERTTGSLQVATQPLLYFSVPTLRSGESVQIIQRKKIASEGIISMVAHVDNSGKLQEENKINNVKKLTTIINGKKLSDLSHSKVEITPVSPLVGDTLLIKTTYFNGGEGRSVSTKGFITIGNESPLIISIPSLEVGEYYSVHRKKLLRSEGIVQIISKIDNVGSRELSLINNEYRTFITVGALNHPVEKTLSKVLNKEEILLEGHTVREWKSIEIDTISKNNRIEAYLSNRPSEKNINNLNLILDSVSLYPSNPTLDDSIKIHLHLVNNLNISGKDTITLYPLMSLGSTKPLFLHKENWQRKMVIPLVAKFVDTGYVTINLLSKNGLIENNSFTITDSTYRVSFGRKSDLIVLPLVSVNNPVKNTINSDALIRIVNQGTRPSDESRFEIVDTISRQVLSVFTVKPLAPRGEFKMKYPLRSKILKNIAIRISEKNENPVLRDSATVVSDRKK